MAIGVDYARIKHWCLVFMHVVSLRTQCVRVCVVNGTRGAATQSPTILAVFSRGDTVVGIQ